MKHEDALDKLIDLALQEDLGTGDLTTELCVEAERVCRAHVKAKSNLVVAGKGAFDRVFSRVDPGVKVDWQIGEGTVAEPGEILVTLEGHAQSLLIGERPALTFLGRLCGIATQTRTWSQLIQSHPRCRLVDTRKTTPGWRALEKAAVRTGGGGNHRMGLFDGILIKENHIAAAGGLQEAIERARRGRHHLVKIEVEVVDLKQLKRALELGVDAVMLDNMDNPTVAEGVRIVRAHEEATGTAIAVEASGNMTAERLASVAALGVDLISMGALTHSVSVSDVSMIFDWD